MMRGLWTSAAGMIGQQKLVDVIANNLANVNTVGYKKSRVDFEDLVYQTLKLAGTPAAPELRRPAGVELGTGVRVAVTPRMFSMGNLQVTGNPLDLAISGDGFFQILLPDGRIAYTRDGTFKKDAEGSVVTSNGYRLYPPVTLPPDAEEISITSDGRILVKVPGAAEAVEVGRIELVRFVNPAGLRSIGKNLFLQTPASGEPMVGTPGKEGFGEIVQGALEMSNVNIVDEMVGLIVAQRAYEFNARGVQTADAMLATANALKR